jgi:hypothetical protein
VKFSIENASRTRIVLADTYVPLFSHHRFLADWQERTYPRLSAEYQDCQRCCRLLNFGLATGYVPRGIKIRDDSRALFRVSFWCVCTHIWFLGMQ